MTKNLVNTSHEVLTSTLASFESRLVLTFWHWLTQVVLENGPFNGSSSSSSGDKLMNRQTQTDMLITILCSPTGNRVARLLVFCCIPNDHEPLTGYLYSFCISLGTEMKQLWRLNA